MICGSSSRGSLTDREDAQKNRGQHEERCELGVDEGGGEPPGSTEAGSVVHFAASWIATRPPSASSGGGPYDDSFSGCQAGENLALVVAPLTQRDEAQPRRISFDDVHGPDLAALKNRGLGNQQCRALAGGEGGAPEHPGPQAWQHGQVDLHGEAARGGIDRGYDFGDMTADGSVQAVDLNRNVLTDPDET